MSTWPPYLIGETIYPTCGTLTSPATGINNNKSIDYFDELPNQHVHLSQQTTISKRESFKKEKEGKKKRKGKETNAHRHPLPSWLCLAFHVNSSGSVFTLTCSFKKTLSPSQQLFPALALLTFQSLISFNIHLLVPNPGAYPLLIISRRKASMLHNPNTVHR